MALIHSFEKSGNFLFRYRGHIPSFLFLIAIPIVYNTDISQLTTTAYSFVLWCAIAVSLLGFLIRAYTIGTTPAGTSGRNTKDGQVANELNTSGIYSMIRHPLYLGNYLIWIGIVIFTFNLWFVIIISLAYWLYYERIMFAEERFLERKFGEQYINWSLKSPAFIPAFGNYRKTIIPFSGKSVLRREYSGILATVFGFAFIDNLRYFFVNHSLEFVKVSNIILLITIALVIILRTIKHYSSLLDESGRS